jgi:hypothetical protein
MSKFRLWYITNQDAISWFIIGLCVGQGIESLAAGNYSSAALSFGVAALNYFFVNFKMKV